MLAVARALAERLPLERTLAVIAEAASSVVPGASATAIALPDAAGGGYRLAGTCGLSHSYRTAVEERPAMMARSATAEAIRRRDIVWIDDPQHDVHMLGWGELVRAEGYRALLAIPLPSAAGPIGTLVTFRTLPGAWNRVQVGLLRAFAEHASSAVQTVRLLDDQEEKVRGLGRLVRSLQAQTHEHANRLHGLRGLLELGDLAEAAALLDDALDQHQTHVEIAEPTDNSVLRGFLLEKAKSAARREIRLEVGPISEVAGLWDQISRADMLTIVGNLLDNAFDAVAELRRDRRVVGVSLTSEGNDWRVEVRDHGRGLQLSLKDALEHGRTTKRGHSGAGLAVVEETVAAAQGQLHAVSNGRGTQFTVVFSAAHRHV